MYIYIGFSLAYSELLLSWQLGYSSVTILAIYDFSIIWEKTMGRGIVIYGFTP